ncbi:MBL fold metallo-hydrolase [Deinococcus antarcticus]|uniref:MBL fold metallo-hydrolase n=1 Tax=Deinococcus antarcticus TaxID=1298767 RepID=A0ABV8AE65_9DEIO
MPDFSFLGLGGTDEVGASSYLYLLTEGRLLIDAGLRPGQIGEAALPRLELLQDNPPDAMILTHAHLDHVAALPVVLRRFPSLKVYCTTATARLSALTLTDTFKIGQRQGQVLFGTKDLQRSLAALTPLPYFERVSDHGFAFTLYPAGHLLGAASVLIESSAGTIFHTADVNNVATHVTPPAWMPGEVTPVDAVVSESTYGDTLLPARKEQVRSFVAATAQTLNQGGKVLIPSFALGRAQDIALILQSAVAGKQLPQVPIYLDGLTREVTTTYEELLPLLPEALQNRAESSRLPPFLSGAVQTVKDNDQRKKIIASKGAAVVISSSGMLHAGVSPLYARHWLPDPDNALFIVGYQDAEAPGRRLLELENGGEVLLPDPGGEGFSPVAAYSRIQRYYLSAHADQGGLLGLIHRYDPGKVILTHGETAPRHALKTFLDTKKDVALPAAGEEVPLKDSGRRRRAFLSVPNAKTPEAVKQRHRRFATELNYDPKYHVLVLQLPEEIPGNLFADGTYTVEVVRGKLTKVKLTEQQDVQGDEPSTESGQSE